MGDDLVEKVAKKLLLKGAIQHTHNKIKNKERADNVLLKSLGIAFVGSLFFSPFIAIPVAIVYWVDECNKG